MAELTDAGKRIADQAAADALDERPGPTWLAKGDAGRPDWCVCILRWSDGWGCPCDPADTDLDGTP